VFFSGNFQDFALGMRCNAIPDNKITASSGTAGDQARLNYNNGPSWCAMGSDANPYLQIELVTPHIICAVSTQGNQHEEQWVKTFQLSFSVDGKAYKHYSESGKTQQVSNTLVVVVVSYYNPTADDQQTRNLIG
jgi:hypothetical protein